MLPRNHTIDSNVYCRQAIEIERRYKKKRPELANRKDVLFNYDNAKLCMPLVTFQKLMELIWELMPHPPFDRNLAPLDCVSRSLQNHLNSKIFDQAIQNELD